MFLALRELKHSKLRYFLIGAIMMLIAWLVFLLSGLANGLSSDNGSALKYMNADSVVFQKDVRLFLHRSILPMEKVDDITEITGVNNAAPLGQLTVTSENINDSSQIDATILAIDPKSFLAPKIIDGIGLDEADSNSIVVNDSFKRHGVEIGDKLKITPSEKEFTVVGFTTRQTYNHLPVIFMHIPQWQELKFALPGSNANIENPISGIAVQVSDDALLEEVNTEIEKTITDVEVATRQVALENLPGYKEEMGTITMMLVFLFIIASFVIAVFLYVITLQKTNQFGVLKAIGAKNSFLAKNLIGQVFILSVFSIFIGVLLTYGVAAIIPPEVPFSLDTSLVVIYSFVLLAVSLLGSLLSLRRIAKIDALEAIGRAD